MSPRTSLGLDMSTQSLSAVILRRDSEDSELRQLGIWSVRYDNFLTDFALRADTMCVAEDVPGFFAQPPGLFLRCIDTLFSHMQNTGVKLGQVDSINCATQQHGQIWLNDNFFQSCVALADRHSGERNLEDLLEGTYAYANAPIWMCTQTEAEAGHLRRHLGNKQILRLSGSAAPLRFSGLVARWLARKDPGAYGTCRGIHLLSSWLAAVLGANPRAPVDWGNAAGTGMMDYQRKTWSPVLLEALAGDLPGGVENFAQKLPGLSSPMTVVGNLASYFRKYGFSGSCRILAGSGDNPQSKVCSSGDLLSLGTSFVMMSVTDRFHPWANAMYDGLGRPFSFACRTNGALVWDNCRKALNLDIARENEALAAFPPGSVQPCVFKALGESFPPGPPGAEEFEAPYPDDPAKSMAAIIDGTLVEMKTACDQVFPPSTRVLYVTGGPSRSERILERIRTFWNRPVTTIPNAGAAYGAALAGLKDGQAIDNTYQLSD